MHKKSKQEESPLYSDPSGGPQRVTGPATSLGSPQFLREWKSLSSSRAQSSLVRASRRPGGTLRLSPGPPVSSQVTAVSLLQVSDLTQTLGLRQALLYSP